MLFRQGRICDAHFFPSIVNRIIRGQQNPNDGQQNHFDGQQNLLKITTTINAQQNPETEKRIFDGQQILFKVVGESKTESKNLFGQQNH